MIRSLLTLLVAFTTFTGYCQSPDSTVLRMAEEKLAAGQCKAVHKVIKPLLEREAPPAEAVLLQAKCFVWHQDKLEEGLRELEVALQREPEQTDLLLFRANLYNDMHMFDRAEADLERALTAARDTATLLRAYHRSAWNKLSLRLFDQAMQAGLAAYALDSTSAGALNTLAMIASEVGDTTAAYTYLKAYIRHHPEEDVAWTNMGFFLGKIGRHKEALTYYDKAEAVGRQDALFFNNRGYSRLGIGDVQGARTDTERSIKLNPRNAYAYRNLALIELEVGNAGAACDALENALRWGFTKLYGDEVQELRRKNCE